MDWRIFPFELKTESDSFEDLRIDIESRMQESQVQLLDAIGKSNKDYRTYEDHDDKTEAHIGTKFDNQLHGIRKFKTLSDQVLYFKFHSEIEDEAHDLNPTFKRYDEHHTKIKIPPRFSKPFFVYYNDLRRGTVLAPYGTPKRVNYIRDNDLTKILKSNFKQERLLDATDMDVLLDRINKEGENRIKGISRISAQVTDGDDFRQSHSYDMSNIGDYRQLKGLREKYDDFRLYMIEFRVQYGESAIADLVKLTLRSQGRKSPISASIDSKKIEQKRDLIEWVGQLLS